MPTVPWAWPICRRAPSACMPPTIPAARRTSNPRSTGGSSSRGPGSARLVAAGDRIAPVTPEGAPAYPHPRRCLPPLVLIAFDHVQDPPDHRPVKAARRDLVHRQVLFDEGLENRIQHLVGRQTVGVFLFEAQLRR